VSTFIKDMASFVPSTRISIEEYCARIPLPANQVQVLRRYHGIRQIAVSGSLGYFDLMYEPVRQVIGRNDISKVKYLIHVCVSPAWPFVHSAMARLKEETGLLDAQCFSIGIHECASTIEAFHVASLLLQGEDEDKEALVVVSDWEVRPNRNLPHLPVCGDGGAAILFSRSPGDHRYLGGETTANVAFASGIWRDAKEDIEYQKKFFSMVEANIQLTLDRARLKLQDIRLVVPLNSSTTSLWMLAKHFGLSPDVFFTKNIGETAHIFGADVIINLERALQEGDLKKGDYYLMFLIGASGAFGSAAFQY
jgi:3-oxoacyl-[acyl-carrier-protein] synthase III